MVVVSKQEQKHILQALLAKVKQKHRAKTKQQHWQQIVHHQQEIAQHRQQICKILARTNPVVPNGTRNHPVVPNETINPPSWLFEDSDSDSDLFDSDSETTPDLPAIKQEEPKP
eukprot:jgi/Psemu1/21298/gm1.21298_g